jgi:hypothetical protein
MKRIPRRIFTAEFKCEAIKLVTEQGLTLAEASRKLDVGCCHQIITNLDGAARAWQTQGQPWRIQAYGRSTAYS